MTLPTTHAIDVNKFTELFVIVKWYNNMPACLEVGDRFHETVNETMMELAGSLDNINEDYYFGDFTVNSDQHLIATVADSDLCEDVGTIRIIPIHEG